MNFYSKLSVPLKSKGRIFKEKINTIRSPYQRDRDRIVHSTAFRRLKHKTQVFVNTSDDHYRTRITHSLEVSQIARTLAKYFKLNEDLCETLSLAHDLGHTPFGHAGEDALNDCMNGFGGFDHNIQTLRIVTIIENKYFSFKGLNLSLETLDGLIKHNGPVKNVKKIENIVGKKIFKNKINFLRSPSLEAQIASISDDIAYNSHDLEDGLKANLFNIEELMKISEISQILKKHNKKLNQKYYDELIIRQITRDIIDRMVMDVIRNTEKNIKKNNIKTIDDVYKQKKNLVCFSSEMKKFDIEIKSFLKKKMYFNSKILKKTNYGKKIIKKLFLIINKKPKDFLKGKFIDNFDKYRKVCDFIAGMTDRYAINLYNKIK